jgi:hypothetical protein
MPNVLERLIAFDLQARFGKPGYFSCVAPFTSYLFIQMQYALPYAMEMLT